MNLLMEHHNSMMILEILGQLTRVQMMEIVEVGIRIILTEPIFLLCYGTTSLVM